MRDEKGNPILDAEGGWFIQPEKGFVVKTKDQTGQKVFLNMTSHDHIDPFEERAVPLEQQKEHGTSEMGMRIPLSLGAVREESDKSGAPA